MTARGQKMRDGYIIDGWRSCGRLIWWPVKNDTYPWKEEVKETAWIRDDRPARPTATKPRRKPAAVDDRRMADPTQAPARVGGGAGSLE